MKTHPDSYLKKPLQRFLIHTVGWAVAIVLASQILKNIPNDSAPGQMAFYILPALALIAWLYILYAYLRHYDEMLREVLTQALAFSSLAGLVVLFASMAGQALGGNSGIRSAAAISVMALAFIARALYLKWKMR